MPETLSEEIDYKTLFESMQGENERLRLRIVKLRTSSSLFEKLDMENIRAFVEENYLTIVVALSILITLLSLITAVVRLSKGASHNEG